MSITLEQLYRQTREQYCLEILAAGDKMGNKVTRLYCLEDISIIDWTRRGELIVTTAPFVRNKNSLKQFIEALLPFEPSGIIINIGGNLQEVPREIIDYCESMSMPLLTFPWHIFLQDLIQDWTNRIFEADQRENNIANAFLNAIYVPEARVEYAGCLERNGFGTIGSYRVVSVQLVASINNNIPLLNQSRSLAQAIGNICSNVITIPIQGELLLIFYGQEDINKILTSAFTSASNYTIHAGIGTQVDTYENLRQSYDMACRCRRYALIKGLQICAVEDLGPDALLLACDKEVLKSYIAHHLSSIMEYDLKNQADLTKTLESYIRHRGNCVEVAKELYVHRNTVNYRIRQIKELTGCSFESTGDYVAYSLAFSAQNIISL